LPIAFLPWIILLSISSFLLPSFVIITPRYLFYIGLAPLHLENTYLLKILHGANMKKVKGYFSWLRAVSVVGSLRIL
jgi:hypothetical protein